MKNKTIIFAALASITLHADYTYKLLTGTATASIRSFIIEQRIRDFRGYPYLYEANPQDEQEYVDFVLGLPATAIAVAYYEGKPVGFVSGTSFMDFADHFKGSQELFEKAEENPSVYYYFPEYIIMPQHQGQHLATILGGMVEEFAQTQALRPVALSPKAMTVILLNLLIILTSIQFGASSATQSHP